MGCYENSKSGYPQQALSMLTGVPVFNYLTSTYAGNGAGLFTFIKDHQALFHFVTATTPSSSTLGLTASHSYSVLGTFTLTDLAAATHNLYIVKDPTA